MNNLASKVCPKCGQEKQLSEFYNARGKVGGSSYCKPCSAEIRREHRKQKPHLVRKANLMSCYGISPEDYDEMLKSQDHKCAICGTSDQKLFVDHCHSTGRVRSLLCHNCNAAIGHLREDVVIAERALEYIRAL